MGLYQKAASGDNEMLTPYYLHKVAMMYYADGKTKEAAAQLEVITNKYPAATEAKDAEKLLARLQ